jgi:SAM-dependent methyltransferase
MFTRPWEAFYKKRIALMLGNVKEVIDIGGGLRIDSSRNNRIDPKNIWIAKLIHERGISYKVLDYVDTYHPDIVGDIQNLPLGDNSQQALICNAILEHVENPFKAAGEMHRVLKPGGYCFVYVPFLYYYHAEAGYYGDYWRYTGDSLRLLFKPFSIIEIQNVRGACETLVRLTPFGRWQACADLAFLFDRVTGKLHSKQTSGFFVFLQK